MWRRVYVVYSWLGLPYPLLSIEALTRGAQDYPCAFLCECHCSILLRDEGNACASEIGSPNVFLKCLLSKYTVLSSKFSMSMLLPEVDRHIQALWHGSGRLDSGVLWAISLHGLQHRITRPCEQQAQRAKRLKMPNPLPVMKQGTSAVRCCSSCRLYNYYLGTWLYICE